MPNKDNNKRIAKNTLMLYIRMMLVMLISLYTSRIVLEILGVDDYGIYNLVGGVVSMFVFLNSALGSTTSRFMAFGLGKENMFQLKKIFSSAFTIHVFFAFVILILLETIGIWFLNFELVIPAERLCAANWVLQFSIFSSVIGIIQVPLTATIIAHERMNIYAYIGIFDVTMKLLIVILLKNSEFDKLITYGFLLSTISLFLFIIYNIYCKIKFIEYNPRFLFEKSLFKEMLCFSGWSFIGSFSSIMKYQGINMIVNIFYGPAVNAARGIAYQVGFAVSSLTQNFIIAINPQIIKNYANGEISTMISLLIRGAKFSYFLLLLLGLPLMFETEFILNLWLIDVPVYSVIFTRLIIINLLLESFTFVLGASIQATGKIKMYQIIVGGFLLLNLPISYLFLNKGFSPQSTLVVSIVLASLALILRIVIIKIQIPELNVKQFTYKVFVVGAIVTLSAISVPFLIRSYLEPGWTKFLIVSISGFFSTSSAIWILGLTKNERSFFVNFIRRRSINI